MISLGT